MDFNRWSARPLYRFAQLAPLPAPEKLVLITIASYTDIDRFGNLSTPQRWLTLSILENDTGLPLSVLEGIVESLCKGGFVWKWYSGREETGYSINTLLATFYEYFEVSRWITSTQEDDEIPYQYTPFLRRLEAISKEIKGEFCVTDDIEEWGKLRPGLYDSYVKRWLQTEELLAGKRLATPPPRHE